MGDFSYADLVTWAKERLPAWQQDALRRLVDKPALSSEDMAKLAAMALAPHVAHSSAPMPVPPSDDKELSATPHPCIQLGAIRDIERVNALAPGPVTFVPKGLAAIYGANGSGKSGVVRILKKACHARDPGGTILPNVFEADSGKAASATIDFIVDGEPRSHNWVDGGSRHSLLQTVNVFDSRCAAVQVEKAYLVLYTPEILHIFRLLASAIDDVADTLRTQRNALGVRLSAITALTLNSETAAGKFLASLSGTSQIDDLETLCTLTDVEKERVRELDRALADDPSRRAVAEDTRARVLQGLATAASSASNLIGDDAYSAFVGVLARRDKTREAADVAREAFSAKSDLSGVGTDAWRTLWESARTYSENHAYVTEPFPVLRGNTLCVLCQQELSPLACSRLHSFEEFVKADVQQKADRAASEVQDAVEAVRVLSLSRSVKRDLREAGVLALPEGAAARTFLVVAKVRRRQLLKLAAGRPIGNRPSLPTVPKLTVALRGIRDEADRLRLASNARERQDMDRERVNLKARVALSFHLESMRAEIYRLKRVAEFDRAIDDCKTQPITLKRREAAASVLTDRLRSSFQANLLRLGFSESPVEVKLGAGDHGEHPVELKLVARPEVGPEEILSEGERTCVALAGLLAEVDATGNRAALVLDDPVSSLDHQYRKRVAERLVREAKERQVIVFTHDIVFLYLLRKYQSELGVPMSELSLERGYKGNHARPKDGPPWIAMSVKDRVKCLREEALQARKCLKEDETRTEYDRRASEIYKKLRMSWERFIEEVLLNQTVLRFGDAVQTRRLAKLIDITDADIELVTREMSRCSDFEHDESGAVHADLPGPDIIEDDIRRLDDWVKALRIERGRN